MPAVSLSTHLFSLTDDLSLLGGLLLGFVGILSMAGSDQVVLQQYLTASSEKEAKASLWRNGIFLKPVSLIYPFVGLIMFAYYRAHPEVARLMRIPDDALPVFVTNVSPWRPRLARTIAMIAAVLDQCAVRPGGRLRHASSQLCEPVVRPPALRPWVAAAGTVVDADYRCDDYRRGLRRATSRAAQQRHPNPEYRHVSLYRRPARDFPAGDSFPPGKFAGSSDWKHVRHIRFYRGVSAVVQIVAPTLPLGILRGIAQVSSFYFAFIGAVVTTGAGYAASLLFAPPAKDKVEGLTRRSLPAPNVRTETPVA